MTRGLRRAWSRLRGSLFGRRRERDLAEEIDAHIQLLADENIRRGLTPEEARRAARVTFGSVESTKESYRDQQGMPSLDSVVQDLRYAIRGFRKNPGFAAVAILSLAIGIGANTAIFSIVDGVLLRPLAYKEPQRLFAIREAIPQVSAPSLPVNPLHARTWDRDCTSFENVALMAFQRANIAPGGEPVSVFGAAVPHDLFSLFGAEPMLGRSFRPEEEKAGNDRIVILSESIWRSRFNADRSLIGKSILIDGRNHEVIGILPAWFRLPYSGGMEAAAPSVRVEVFRPLVLGPEEFRPMGNFNYGAVARLKPDVSVQQALAEINTVQAQFPTQAGEPVELKATLIPIHDIVAGRARLGLWMLAAAVGAVLLIVCLNLANLLLSRIVSRSREAAIRTALGASRGRQFRQVLTESLVLSFSGGILGVILAAWIIQVLVASTTLDLPRLEEIRLDASVLSFSFGVTILTGFLFGTIPAWRLTRGDPQEALRSGSHTVTEARSSLRLRESLIGLEVGLSATLLIVAGLLATSFTRLLQVDKGFDLQHILTVDVGLAGDLYSQPAAREKFFDRVRRTVAAIPGVESAGLTSQLPASGQTWIDPIYLEGDTRPVVERPLVNNRYTSPGYFEAMKIAIRRGRAFEESDHGREVGILSEKAARLLWPGETDPVGRRFVGEDNKVKTLIGVVADVRAALHSVPPPTAYYPYWQRVPAGAVFAIRTSADPSSIAGAVRDVLRSEDAQLPIRAIRSMEEVVDRSLAQRRFQLTLVAAFAASALVVASLGIYGVVAYSVSRRRTEIGIRIALGAQRSRLLGLILRQGMTPVVAGLAAGIGFAFFLSRWIRGLLYEVQPADPLIIAGVASMLLGVGVLACLIPARRAAGMESVTALRLE